MGSESTAVGARPPGVPEVRKLLEQYGCGPVQFTGTDDALYERHLMFDGIVDPTAVGPRERYEAIARAVLSSLETCQRLRALRELRRSRLQFDGVSLQ